MAYVYKITREDGLEYIGITNRLKKRLNEHKNSKRFAALKIQTVEILFEGEYEECERLEESFIIKFNTFYNGLNMTNKGKGKSDTEKFNTLGYKFSDESRRKMSASSKLRGPRPTGYKHAQETKDNWSKLRKGKSMGAG